MDKTSSTSMVGLVAELRRCSQVASWRKPICQRGQKRAQSSIHKQVVCQPVFSQTVSREGREGGGGGVAIGRANPSSPSSSSSPSPPPPLPPPPPSSSSACLSIHASCCPLQRSPLSRVHYKCSHNRAHALRMWKTRFWISGHREEKRRTINADGRGQRVGHGHRLQPARFVRRL